MKRHCALALVVGLIFGAALLRLLPHPPNFAPIVAMALFAGAVLPDRRWAVGAPLLAMGLSDLVLGLHAQMGVVYLSVLACVGIGTLLRDRIRLATVAAGALCGSLAFFVLTNLGVWLGSGMYPLTVQGLATCFVAALPFLDNSLAGDALYCAVLFGGHAALVRLAPGLRLPAARPA